MQCPIAFQFPTTFILMTLGLHPARFSSSSTLAQMSKVSDLKAKFEAPPGASSSPAPAHTPPSSKTAAARAAFEPPAAVAPTDLFRSAMPRNRAATVGPGGSAPTPSAAASPQNRSSVAESSDDSSSAALSEPSLPKSHPPRQIPRANGGNSAQSTADAKAAVETKSATNAKDVPARVSPPAHCNILAAILDDISAPELFRKLIFDEEDDDSLEALSKYKASKLAQKFRISLHLAEAFAEKCKVAIDDADQPAMIASLLKLGFEAIEFINKGAFGAVFKCKNTTDKRIVAVKFFNQPLNPKDAEREGQRLRLCDHPNIVRMHRVHLLHPEKCVLEMDFVPGGDLRRHLVAAISTPDRRLPFDAVARFTRQLLLALVYLHEEKGWLHGDIKPENILLTAQPLSSNCHTDYSNSSIKLTDFGLSKTFAPGKDAQLASMLSNATSTKTGHIKGTLWYISPEMLQGVAAGRARSSGDDVWSACLVILEMDTGLNLQELMIAPGAVNFEKMLLNASSLLLPLLYCGLSADSKCRCSSARELLHILDTHNDHQFEWQEFDGARFVLAHAARDFVLERGLLSDSDCVSLPLSSPVVFDIGEIRHNSLALGRTLSPVNNRPIRRKLKQTGTGIPVWQRLIDGKEWVQCSPAVCAQLNTEFQKPHRCPDQSQYRRVLLQPTSLGGVQNPFAFRRNPYLISAGPDDIMMMNNRVHDSLPEWDVCDMSQVVNQVLQNKYAVYRHRVAGHCNGNPNERLLFHFCPADVVPRIWEQGDGHDPRMSRWAEVGQGAYFSEHVMYGYAYKYKLFPSPTFDWILEDEPPVGSTIQLFASLVTLGRVADMGPGCESCPSPQWVEWKTEVQGYQRPTRPPSIKLPDDAAERSHLLDLVGHPAPRYDSVSSTEGHLHTHSDSSSKTPSGHRVADVMHPRLRDGARDWGQQYVVFETHASFPLFLITLRKVRESPVDQQLLRQLCYPSSETLSVPLVDAFAAQEAARRGIFALLGLQDLHRAFSAPSNSDVELVDVDHESPFHRFVLERMRGPIANVTLSRISMVKTRRQAAFCSDVINESNSVGRRAQTLLPTHPQDNPDFDLGLSYFSSICEIVPGGICDNAHIVFAWHGAGAGSVDGVCADGPRAFRTTDGGYFGCGSYMAVECGYAARYSRASSNANGEYAVILFACYVCPFPYVVTQQTDYLREHNDDLYGFSSFYSLDPKQAKSLMRLYNAHFIPVRSYGDTNPLNGLRNHRVIYDFQACSETGAECHELVLENHRQSLPVAVLWFRSNDNNPGNPSPPLGPASQPSAPSLGFLQAPGHHPVSTPPPPSIPPLVPRMMSSDSGRVGSDSSGNEN